MSAMTSNGRYILISADCHAGARIDAYRDYLDPKYRDDFDAWRGRYRNPSKEHLGGKKTKNWDSDERVRDLESDGVVAEVVFPNTVPPFFPSGVVVTGPPGPKDYEHRLAGVRAHNRWLAEWCSDHPERRAGIGLILLNDLDDAIEDVKWVAENGLRGGILLPGVPDDAVHLKPLYAPDYDRLWAACQDRGVVVNQHSGAGSPDYGDYPIAQALWVTEMQFYTKRGFTHLIMGGAFERFPKLRYILTEAGCAWAIPVLKQLDSLHQRMTKGFTGEVKFAADATLKEPPSFYAKRNCFYGASFPSPKELQGREIVGVDHILWGADYPHFEGTYPYTREHLRLTFHDIDPEQVVAMVTTNAAALYGFDLEKLAVHAQTCGPTPAEIQKPLARAEFPKDATSPAFFIA